MALSRHARQVLCGALASTGAADRLADIIDAGTGTVDADLKRRLVIGMSNRKAATSFIAKVESSAALTGREIRCLAKMLGNYGVAKEIDTQLST